MDGIFGNDPFENLGGELLEYLDQDVDIQNGSVLDDSVWIVENLCEHVRGPALSGRVADSLGQFAGDVASSLILSGWDCSEVFLKLSAHCCTGCVVARYGRGAYIDCVLCTGVLIRTANIGGNVVICGYHELSLYSRGSQNGCSSRCCGYFYRWLNSSTLSHEMGWDFGRLPPLHLRCGNLKLGTKPWCKQN